ncbi:hypothetical protein HF521_001027 [Silurus meridionalis]|uniref:Uncharacterized protein n=1 Tax=Silurus meridionalis TaxID=175797 RepID=A0A8T0C0T4_SILME|nr:hypothetical protein HF521_001027 [Silurus meridionalis]
MTEEQKQLVFSLFIFPFLSKDGSPDPGCVSTTSGSNDWLLTNLGSFFNYATLTELKILNANFSSVAVFGLLSIEQKAQFILHPDTGVLGNDSMMREVFSSMIASFDLNQLAMFFTTFSQTAKQMNIKSIPSSISDTILNMMVLDLVPRFQCLSCYGGGSFYMFLKQLFLSFGFPDLIDFLSLIPDDRQTELHLSEELGEFLNRPNTVVNGSQLCTLLDKYSRTNQYLEMEPVLSSVLASQTLECVWPRALSASTQADVEQWFNVILVHYLPYLRSQLISSTQLSGASCLSYRKLVSILGDNFNFSAADFSPADVYSSIKVYLRSGNASPRCYNSSDPFLNSTAWFADNIGFFITFITLSDLQSFLSGSMSSVFLENSENLQLFNNPGISASVLSIIQHSCTSRILTSALSLLCQSPASVFVFLGDADIQTILTSINIFCTEINPEVTAVLVAKFLIYLQPPSKHWEASVWA